MKRKIRYQCKTDLKLIRQLLRMSKEEVADKIFCSIRTIERIEKENATASEENAKLLADLYGLDYKQQFYRVNKRLADWLKNALLESTQVKVRNSVCDSDYYCIYIRKTGIFEDCVLGKGMWIRNFNRNKEVRKLQKINVQNCIESTPEIPIINTDKEWDYWYAGLILGKIYKVIVSEKCMKQCLSSCLKETVVRRDELFRWDGTTDIMCWGCKAK